MIFINGNPVNLNDLSYSALKSYLNSNHLILVNKENVPLMEDEIIKKLEQNVQEYHFNAIHSKELLTNFCEELRMYFEKLEAFIETAREEEQYDTVNTAFINVIEALMEFMIVQRFIDKTIYQASDLENLSTKALQQAQIGNNEYVLDLIEYEVFPLVEQLLKEIEERIYHGV